ncbi:MAG: hypothetical protein IKU29_03655 [Parabacteroides sp.]|nr:hypothetical protein [Parabacteroides sp.]
MKNLNESLLESIGMIEEQSLESEIQVMLQIGTQYAKVGLLMEYAEEDVVDSYDIIQESTLFMEAKKDKKNDKEDTPKESVWSKIKTKVKNVLTMIGNLLKKAWEWICKKTEKIRSKISSLFSKKKNSESSKIDEITEQLNENSKELDKLIKDTHEVNVKADEEIKKAEENIAKFEKTVNEIKEKNEAQISAEKVEEILNNNEKTLKEIDKMMEEHDKLPPEIQKALEKDHEDYKKQVEDAKARIKEIVEGGGSKVLTHLENTLESLLNNLSKMKSTNTTDSESSILQSWGKTAERLYNQKFANDKNLKIALDEFTKQIVKGGFSYDKLFETHFDSSGKESGKHVDSYEPIFKDPNFFKLTSGITFIKQVKTLREVIKKHELYTFDKIWNTDTKPTSIYNDSKLKYIQGLLDDFSIYSSEKNVEEFEEASKILETEVMPGIAQATTEMMAFSNFILAVYNEMSKQTA